MIDKEYNIENFINLLKKSYLYKNELQNQNLNLNLMTISDNTTLKSYQILSEIYNKYKEKDGFLYLYYFFTTSKEINDLYSSNIFIKKNYNYSEINDPSENEEEYEKEEEIENEEIGDENEDIIGKKEINTSFVGEIKKEQKEKIQEKNGEITKIIENEKVIKKSVDEKNKMEVIKKEEIINEYEIN